MVRLLSLTVTFMVIIVVVNLLVLHSLTITESKIGQYREKDVAIVLKKNIFNMVGTIKNGDVVVVKNFEPLDKKDVLAEVKGVPGDTLQEHYFFFSGDELNENTLPKGDYLIKNPQNTRVWVIPETEIKEVVWFPLLQLRKDAPDF
ncbi:hypothetical protein HY045_00190 [Candidatus Woesebacteria bacterium]|nr:hypothetical protein [Candidatus Woesebacteria bacterium]